jgi:hypothetical protein
VSAERRSTLGDRPPHEPHPLVVHSADHQSSRAVGPVPAGGPEAERPRARLDEHVEVRLNCTIVAVTSVADFRLESG